VKAHTVLPEFVEFIPGTLQDGVLYISRKYATATHRCCCGCGVKIVTPLKPTDWALTVTNGAVSLHPSVGNWNHPCQSHYVIRNNRVLWAGQMTLQQIQRGRKLDQAAKDAYYGAAERAVPPEQHDHGDQEATGAPQTSLAEGLWPRLKRWWQTFIGH